MTLTVSLENSLEYLKTQELLNVNAPNPPVPWAGISRARVLVYTVVN